MASISIWEQESFFAPQDIIIVGAGLMGLWSALELKKKNSKLKITLLERNITPLGASTRNAGFACFGSPTELIHDAAVMGEDTMLQLVEMRYKGIQKIRHYFPDNSIDYDACYGYECIPHESSLAEDTDENIALLNRLLSPVIKTKNTFVRTDEKIELLGLQNFSALIENRFEGSLHSGKLVQMLTRKVQSLGVQIIYNVEVTGWQQHSNYIQIQTNQHFNFTTHQLLFCTNAFTNKLLPQLNITPARGQAIVTTPIANLPLKGTFHFDEGFYYWRNINNRILLGGARNAAMQEEETTDLSGSELIREKLLEFIHTHFIIPSSIDIDYHWSGIMGFIEIKQPIVTSVDTNIFAAIACNGMGVALTPMIAEKVAHMIVA
jgi:glycine/D-amino acid oxidase-like deaminating enzyme